MNSTLLNQTKLLGNTYDALKVLSIVCGVWLGLAGVAMLLRGAFIAGLVRLALLIAACAWWNEITPDSVLVSLGVFIPTMWVTWGVASMMPTIFGLPILGLGIFAAGLYYSWSFASEWVEACRISRGIENYETLLQARLDNELYAADCTEGNLKQCVERLHEFKKQDFSSDVALPAELKEPSHPEIQTWKDHIDNYGEVKHLSQYSPSYFRAKVLPGMLEKLRAAAGPGASL